MKRLRIAIFLAYGGESHLYWAKQIQNNSVHSVTIITLPPRHWKWRMQGSCGYFSSVINETFEESFDLFILTSMTNVNSFKGLLGRKYRDVPIHTYFHENQFAYPLSSNDPDKKTERLEHYQFIQLQSALASDRVYFNSKYNRDTFLDGVRVLIKKIPDNKNHLHRIFEKSLEIWPLHIDPFEFSDKSKLKNNSTPIFIWNHRWEYDKNPAEFFEILNEIKKVQPFQLIVCGKEVKNSTFEKAKGTFSEEIIHWGFCENRKSYLNLLSKATHSIITSNHDFFGLSAFESLLSGVKTYFPERLCYPEHFMSSEFENVFYKSREDIIKKITLEESYPFGLFKNVLHRFEKFKDIDV